MFETLLSAITPYKWIVASVAAALIAAAGAWGGQKLTAAYYKPLLTEAYKDAATQRQKVAAYGAELVAANQAMDTQSAAVQALQAEAAVRAKASATALAKAQAESDARRRSVVRLRAILSTPLTCEAGVKAAKDAL